MTEHDQVLLFSGRAFHSVWALEVLQLLAQSPDADFSEEKMIVALRSSKAAIGQSLATLEGVGLVTVEDQGARFKPTSPELERLALGAIELYARRPDLVRRTIVSRKSPGIAAFANAFKLRKDQ